MRLTSSAGNGWDRSRVSMIWVRAESEKVIFCDDLTFSVGRLEQVNTHKYCCSVSLKTAYTCLLYCWVRWSRLRCDSDRSKQFSCSVALGKLVCARMNLFVPRRLCFLWVHCQPHCDDSKEWECYCAITECMVTHWDSRCWKTAQNSSNGFPVPLIQSNLLDSKQ